MITWLTPDLAPAVYRRWCRVAGMITLLYVFLRGPALLDTGVAWQPVGALRALRSPLPVGALAVLWVGTALFALDLVVQRPGRWNDIVHVVGSVAALVLLTHRSSLGQILWFDIVMALHLLTIGAAALASRVVEVREAHGWAMRLAALITVVTYVVAGIAKLRIGGTAWVAEGALEGHIAFSASRLELLGGSASPLATAFLELGALSSPLAVAVLALELGAPIALLGRRAAIAWSIATWGMHAFIAVSMFVVFHWPLFGAAFVPVIYTHLAQGDRPDAPTSADDGGSRPRWLR